MRAAQRLHDARLVERAAIHVEPVVVLERVRAQRFAQLRLGIERVDDLLRPPRNEHAAEIEDRRCARACARRDAQATRPAGIALNLPA